MPRLLLTRCIQVVNALVLARRSRWLFLRLKIVTRPSGIDEDDIIDCEWDTDAAENPVPTAPLAPYLLLFSMLFLLKGAGFPNHGSNFPMMLFRAPSKLTMSCRNSRITTHPANQKERMRAVASQVPDI